MRTVRDHAALGDALDAAVVVDKVNARPVEGRQVVVVEARPLAELVVPRLEPLGRCRVLHYEVRARPHLTA
jgi:hypothetical protein